MLQSVRTLFGLRRLSPAALCALMLFILSGQKGQCDTAHPPLPANNSSQQRELAQEFSRLIGQFKTVTARFEQTTWSEAGRKARTSKGTVSLQRPNLFRWQVSHPFAQLIISDGKRIGHYDEDLEQVTFRDMDSSSQTTPALLFSGDANKILKDFSLTSSHHKKNHLFTLSPKQKDAAFTDLRIVFKEQKLHEMSFTDTLGGRTQIRFTEVATNRTLNRKLFEWKIPPGVDVIDQTSKNSTATRKTSP